MTEYIAKCNEVVGISGKALIVPDYIDTSKEIVRCRDCVYYREEYEECMRNLPSGSVVIFDCESHDFCSFGKRKEGE